MTPPVDLAGARTAAREVLARFAELPGIAGAAARLREGARGPVLLGRLAGSSKEAALAAIVGALDRPALYVVTDAERAEAAFENLSFYLSGSGRPVLLFPEYDILPYDRAAPATDVVATRLRTLEALLARKEGAAPIVVATVRSVAQRVPGGGALARGFLRLRPGDPFDFDTFAMELLDLAFKPAHMVEAPGEYSRRGGIFDVFSYAHENPVRIELDGDVISSLREFDPRDQRSIRTLPEARVLPATEFPLRASDLPRVRAALVEAAPGHGDEIDTLLDALEKERRFAGMERTASRLAGALVPLTELLPRGALVFEDEPGLLIPRLRRLWDEARRTHAEALEVAPYVSPPAELFLGEAELGEALASFPRVYLSNLAETAVGAEVSFQIGAQPREAFGRKVELWKRALEDQASGGLDILVLAENQGQRARLEELFERIPLRIEIGVVSAGFLLPDARLSLLTDHEIFARYLRRRRARHFKFGIVIKDVSALTPGDYIVHIDHGIGVYSGMARLPAGGHLTDCLRIEYAEGGKLFVPVDQLSLVQKYSSEEGKRPAVNRLGGTTWEKTKAKARKAIREMAAELLQTYAFRTSRPGFAFPEDTVWQKELEASFIYDETPDQEKAIADVKADMLSDRPMDRLVCGDVGYGKTEVAVRAAFKAVQAGKQVAVLVPTTLLAEQHRNTFGERLAPFPVRVEMLSRFRTAPEQKKVVAAVASGEVDIVIGTHRLLQKDVSFRDLGLVVIDEEQRFGVAAKEKIRRMRLLVDVLTLTATPIPRTLHLSMMGARDISIIETPPEDRLPIRTEIVEYDEEVIVDAVLREVDRGGQVFFVHNRVETIDATAARLAGLLPQVRIAVGHGQMGERELERVMLDFVSGRYDLLVSTLIIESGLDIPTVNTMIVDRSDALGLAQLYQLRGRVGRSSVQAYAYLLVPPRTVLTEQAEKRLRAMSEFEGLGSGFALAMRDLEIRGAGNILGEEQHGFVASVGFDLYCRMLEDTVRELKGEVVEDRKEPRLVTDVDAFLPDDYVEDGEEKLGIYRRLAGARAIEDVDAIEAELADRYGALPDPAVSLLDLRRVRLLAAKLGADSVAVRRERVEIELAKAPTRGELREIVSGITLPIEFRTGERFSLRARETKGDPLRTARMLLLEATGFRRVEKTPSRTKGTS